MRSCWHGLFMLRMLCSRPASLTTMMRHCRQKDHKGRSCWHGLFMLRMLCRRPASCAALKRTTQATMREMLMFYHDRETKGRARRLAGALQCRKLPWPQQLPLKTL